MRDREDSIFYLSAGALVAIGLGVALIPLRTVTTASNLAFVFVAWTILVAELGGRAAAVATALCSALSLNFFLTKPYLRLEIHGRDDVIAVLALMAVGLIAAAFGTRRQTGGAALEEARRQLECLAAAMRRLDEIPLEASLEHVLTRCRDALPLCSAAVRDPRGYVVAASEGAYAADIPGRELKIDELPTPLPPDGGRIPLVASGQPVGWLDVWGDGRPASLDARRTLGALSRFLALRLAAAAAAP